MCTGDEFVVCSVSVVIVTQEFRENLGPSCPPRLASFLFAGRRPRSLDGRVVCTSSKGWVSISPSTPPPHSSSEVHNGRPTDNSRNIRKRWASHYTSTTKKKKGARNFKRKDSCTTGTGVVYLRFLGLGPLYLPHLKSPYIYVNSVARITVWGVLPVLSVAFPLDI